MKQIYLEDSRHAKTIYLSYHNKNSRTGRFHAILTISQLTVNPHYLSLFGCFIQYFVIIFILDLKLQL